MHRRKTMTALARSFTPILAGAVMLVALPNLASAHYMVSAASCQPATSDNSQSAATSAGKVHLINGAWTFRSGQSGYAELACPINFSGTTPNWTLMQLWYRDGFAAAGSSNGYVEADLMRRSRSAGGATQLVWVASNLGNDEYGYFTLYNPPAGPDDFHTYYIRVRLYRANTSLEVAFVGFEIRF
jgi:hypothetical protein